MLHEGILARMGRLLAAIASQTIDNAENNNKVALVKQAIRELQGQSEQAGLTGRKFVVDVVMQAQILQLLERLRSELGLALLLISHDLGIVHHVADTVTIDNLNQDTWLTTAGTFTLPDLRLGFGGGC